MDLRQLEAFVAVAEELHFSRAAEKLQMAQSPLSQRIKVLERELGVRLLERTNRSVALTDAGETVLQEARTTLRAAAATRRAAERARDGETGVLRIGFVASAAFLHLPRLLLAVHEQAADVRVELHRMDSVAQIEALEADRIDTGIARTTPADRDDIRVLRLQPEPLLAVLPSSHRLAGTRSTTLAALADDPWVLPRSTGRTDLVARIHQACAASGFTPHVAHEAPDLPSVLGLVAGRLGVSLVPLGIARLAVPDVTAIAMDPKDRTALPAALVWHRDRPPRALEHLHAVTQTQPAQPSR